MSTESGLAPRDNPSAAGVIADDAPETVVEHADEYEPRNLRLMIWQMVAMRTGWIFKTESVIIPAFLDMISGNAAWVRGFLPVLGRLGQTITPFLYARRLKILPQKKWACWTFSVGLSVPFFVLAALAYFFQVTTAPAWMPVVFLALYTIFFAYTGLWMSAQGTLQGKLIRPNERGKLMAASAVGGTIVASTTALALMSYWLSLPDGAGYTYIFLMTAVCLLISGIPILMLSEPLDDYKEPPPARWHHVWQDAWRIVWGDPLFRRFMPVVVLYGTILILFPHYQALALNTFELDRDERARQLMWWVIVQNVGVGAMATLIGPLADRFGQRLALRVVVAISMLVPLTALTLVYLVPHNVGQSLYWMVFALLGITPLGMRTLTNYTLEIAPRSEHPRYLGTLGLCLAVPFVLSPLVGWMMDAFGFASVLLVGSVMIFGCWLLTFRLVEVRHLPSVDPKR
jgi:MFS family permease